MRFTFVAFLATVLLVCSVAAIPATIEEKQYNITDSRTISALKKLFKPIVSWFRFELPSKTPLEFATDMKETVRDIKEWVDSDAFIEDTKEAVQPVHQWFKDMGNNLKETFSEMANHTKTAASRIDQHIGDWFKA